MAFNPEISDYIKNKIPPPDNTIKKFGNFISSKIQEHGTLCTTVLAEVEKILSPFKTQHQNRFFCRIDTDHKLKSPVGIIEKIIRGNRELGNKGDEFTLENFNTRMTDLARFRIVCNFLSDVFLVQKAIKNSNELKSAFKIKEKISIEQRPAQRKSGERSVKLILEYKNKPGLFLEIQIMTQLAEAWDKKDHYLIYEIRRMSPDKDEENFSDFSDAKMFAMAELLYIADNYFDDLKKQREKK